MIQVYITMNPQIRIQYSLTLSLKISKVLAGEKLKRTVKALEVQHTLVFTTVNEVNYITRRKQIQDCPVDIEDVDNDKTICGKYVPYIKVKTTKNNNIQVTEDLIRVSEELLKLKNMYS